MRPGCVAIGIDVGGTFTRVGAVDGHRVLARGSRFLTPHDDSGAAVIGEIARGVAALRQSLGTLADESDPVCVGLALPGLVDRTRGCLVRSVNLPFLEARPIVAELSAMLGVPVCIVTDADAATWGEHTACDPGPRGFVHLRLGTGIALGFVQRGALVDTAQPTRQSHLEVLITDHTKAAQPCPCGNRGCLETIASGRALVEETKCAGLGDTLTDLHRAWVHGDPRATKIGDSALAALCVALRQIATAFAPEVICIGGGVAKALPRLVERAIASAEETHGIAGTPGSPLYVTARLGDHAGVVGAALLAVKRPAP